MIMKYNLFDIGGEIIKNDEFGIIRENRELGNVWLSTFLLYRGKSSKHMVYHDDDSIYLFIDGRGVFELEKDIIYVNHNDLILVPKNSRHRILNNGDVHMKFLIMREVA